MDWIKSWKPVTGMVEKYKYVLLIIVAGMVLMLLPDGDTRKAEPVTQAAVKTENSVSEELTQILSQIRGVGKVRVMLTEHTGAETVYQSDEDRTEGESSQSRRTETVIVSGDSGDTGLIRTITPPTYLGAIVVCQGAGSPSVRLAVATAVAAVTGISMDRISVLEMK